MIDPSVRRTFLVLLAAALAVRVAAAAALGISGPLVEDEHDYVALAASLARGDGFAYVPPEFPDLPARTAFRVPLVPVVLAPVAALGGGATAMRIVTLVIAALAPPLAYLGLRRTALGERARWVGWALAVWPPAVWLSLRVLSEPLSQALLLGALAVPPSPAAPRRRTALAGALAGLAVLARPAALVPAAFLAMLRGGWRDRAVFVASLVLVVAPWLARNADLHGRPLLTTHTGVTLVGANSAAALDAEWPGRWHAPDVVYAGSGAPPDRWMWGWSELPEEASDRRFRDDALRWVRENPADAARLAAWKLVRLFDPDQHSAKPDAAAKRIVGWISFAPVLVLAAFGARAAVRDPAFRPWLGLVLGTALTALVFYGDVRMRSGADPALLAVAAFGFVAVLGPARLPGRTERPGPPEGRT